MIRQQFTDRADLVRSVAVEFLSTLTALQKERKRVDVCLTGGTVAHAIYAECARIVAEPLDAKKVHLWWGDERFVEPPSTERNDDEAMSLLRRAVDVPTDQIHPMGSPHEYVDAEVAADAYAGELGETIFDVCLLGVGPDGHVASIFPDHASFAPSNQSVIAVEDSPKPPPVRLSLTVERLMTSRQVWFLVAGADKADAVRELVAGTPTIPAGLVRGDQETILWCDDAAASRLWPHG